MINFRENRHRIGFLIPYFGLLPSYLNLFLQSCRKNDKYVFYFISDLILPKDISDNVRQINMSLTDLSHLIHVKVGVKPDIRHPYKLCDFRPAYGVIFEDYIHGFTHWGHLDIDLVLGNISKFITEQLLEDYDIISARKEWVSGAFSVYRNTDKVNHLFEDSPDWRAVFADHQNFIFDETSRLLQPDPLGIYRRLMNGENIEKLCTEITSFTHVVRKQQQSDALRILFQTSGKESISRGMLLYYSSDGIYISKPGESDFEYNSEWLFYHFITEKQKPYFRYPKWNQIPEEYYIDEYGFYRKWQLPLRYVFILHGRFMRFTMKVIRRVIRIIG